MFAAALGLLCLGACSPEPSNTLVVWRTLTGPAGDSVQALADAYPGLGTVTHTETIFQGGYGALALKLRTAAAGGRGPDVSQLGTFEIRTFARQGLLVDLTPYMAGPEGIDTSDWPGSLLDAGRVDGGLYWLPLNVSVPVLYWNRESFGNAGLDAPPATWDAFFEQARRLTVRDAQGRVEQYGLALWNITWPVVSMVWSEGGTLCSPDYGSVTLDDPLAVHILSELQNLLREGVAIMPDAASGGHRAFFKSGRAAMILDSQAVLGEVQRDVTAFTPAVALFPAGAAGRVFAPGGGGLVMCASCPPERRDAAWGFMRYMLAPEQLGTFARESGYLAYSGAAAERSGVAQEEPYATLHQAFQYVRGDFSMNAMPPVRDAFDRAFQRIMTDLDTPVAEALREADLHAEQALRRWVEDGE